MNGYEIGGSLGGLVGGLVLLWWAGSRSVQYAVNTTKSFGLSRFFVGFVLIAVSTGIPELAVVLMSVFQGAPQLSVGDILGSNLHDISMVLGIPLLMYGRVYIKEQGDRRELLISLVLAASVMGLVFFARELHRWHGFALIFSYCLYLIWLSSIEHPAPAVEKHEVPRHLNNNNNNHFAFKDFFSDRAVVIFKLFASLGLVVLAAKLSVTMAIQLSSLIGLSAETLGVSFVALGTSLPELIVSLHAIKRKEYSLAVGNAVGSVFQQGTFILGILALLSRTPLQIKPLNDIFAWICFCHALLLLCHFSALSRS